MGKEGNQAASFADYAIPEFRNLRRLLFWHGRNFGQRVTDYSCTCIYKSIAFSLMLVFANFRAGYSGLMMLDDVYYAFYNTSMTTIAMGMAMLFDQDSPFMCSADTSIGAKPSGITAY